MRTLTSLIQKQTELIFYNMQISMKTCDPNYIICGTPVWRYFYHTIHSCDKWFINPSVFTEPSIHFKDLDRVDYPCEKELTMDDLFIYLEQVHKKIVSYLEHLTDEQLSESPLDCPYTRIELILGQYRHFMCHIGIFNGITIAITKRYPMVAGLDQLTNHTLDGKLYDE